MIIFNFPVQGQPPEIDPKTHRLYAEMDVIDRLLRTVDLPLLQEIIERETKLFGDHVIYGPLWERAIVAKQILFFSAVELLRARRELQDRGS